MNERDWEQENAWLEKVLCEVRRRIAENGESDERLRADAVETQKELWESVGGISGGSDLGQLADFMQYIDAMKRQKRSHGEYERLRLKYEKMLRSPYFGKIDFQKEGEAAAQSTYVGLSNLIDEKYRVLVCDWRAPVASLFYDYETGPASYECPKGTVAGELTGKRQFRIEAGKIAYMFDSSLKIDDEILQQILSRSTENKMKAIVTSIQREQNRAIRNEAYQNLVVQGPAGSGKTSIALHRAAYLLYRHRDRITASNIIIFSPNRLFNDYISDVLPELGEENILQTTFAGYMHSALPVNLKKENPNDMMEYILRAKDWPGYARRAAGIRFKASPTFMEALERYADAVVGREPRFEDVVVNGAKAVCADELRELYSEEYRLFPIKRRFEKIRDFALSRLKRKEDERIRELAATLQGEGGYADRAELRRRAAAVVKKETEGMRARIDEMTAFDLVSLYRQFFEQLPRFVPEGDGEELAAIAEDTLGNLDAGYLHYEDQAPLLYLDLIFGGFPKTAQIRFVIIDEAQDYTPLQFKIFRKLFSGASLTMLGDPDQAINPYMNIGGYEQLSRIFPQEDTLHLRLARSYRSTAEIGAFARRLLGDRVNGESVERHGEAPAVLGFPDKAAILGKIALDLAEFRQKGYRSVGIVTRVKQEANEVYQALKGKPNVHAVLSGEEGFSSGAVVLPAYLAKGLEFDAVIIHDAGGGNYAREEERLLLYTACTRALHELRVYHTGALTPLFGIENGARELREG